jgi:hypothetical protein
MKLALTAIGAACIALASTAVFSQEAQNDRARSPGEKKLTIDDTAANFIAKRSAMLSGETAKLDGSAGSELNGLQGMVKAVAVKMPQPVALSNPNKLTELAELFVRDIALKLASHGFKAGDIRSAGGGGTQLVEAAAASLRGTSTLAQEKLLADTVFVGTITGYDEDTSPGDGLRSTLSMKVVQAEKGVEVGQIVKLRQASGSDSTATLRRSHDITSVAEGQYQVVASEALYARGKTKARGRSSSFALPILPIRPAS